MASNNNSSTATAPKVCLVFAKVQLIDSKGVTSEESFGVSSVSISSIIDSMEKENPEPKVWLDWISSKLLKSA